MKVVKQPGPKWPKRYKCVGDITEDEDFEGCGAVLEIEEKDVYVSDLSEDVLLMVFKCPCCGGETLVKEVWNY